MTLKLPAAPKTYDPVDQAQLRRALEVSDSMNAKLPIILKATDGSRWKLVVDTAGVLSTVAA